MHLKGTLSPFLSLVLSLYGICYILTGIKFLSWMEQYRVTGSYCTLQSNRHEHKQMANRIVSHKELTRYVKKHRIWLHPLQSRIFCMSLLSLLRDLLSFLFHPFPSLKLAQLHFFCPFGFVIQHVWLAGAWLAGCLLRERFHSAYPPPFHPPTHPPLGQEMWAVLMEADRQGWSVSTSTGCDSRQRST